ncbi:hypothetical protein MGYG_06176 [Nannizzia gypsea CBS 118893]|uniref:Uncharacterized protein n=1 Tax=Arthroderma gypseum (strain ATCC MYA-4604 / CBS 118893) TaxID=535722 RepID=E4V0P3_ARTGP|nr:hypothetical protein MGYG_06176 [Nannizzia gypsea CBS 118893]EFR03180.1 hypothetical protein MGYG_06176 [Nannizzia gypsea CBS 118893]
MAPGSCVYTAAQDRGRRSFCLFGCFLEGKGKKELDSNAAKLEGVPELSCPRSKRDTADSEKVQINERRGQVNVESGKKGEDEDDEEENLIIDRKTASKRGGQLLGAPTDSQEGALCCCEEVSLAGAGSGGQRADIKCTSGPGTQKQQQQQAGRRSP